MSPIPYENDSARGRPTARQSARGDPTPCERETGRRGEWARMKRSLLLLFCCALLTPTPGHAVYATGGLGYWSDGTRTRLDAHCLPLSDLDEEICRVQAFKRKPFVVVAFIDTGINPYHQEFRAPEFTVHPSEYIENYPATAKPLNLSLDATDYASARADDEGKFLLSGATRLHWVPGTRIIGTINIADGATSGGREELPNLDDEGHGTGSISVAAGQTVGSNPNALIVSIEGLGERALQWAAKQPWIDVISNSWGPIANIPVGSTTWTRRMTDDGKIVAFAAGNGFSNFGLPDRNTTLTSPYTAPSWVVTVGAVDPADGQATWWHAIPVDVSSFGTNWPSAHPFSLSASSRHGGTSCATPVAAGVLSAQVLAAREAFGDTVEGPHAGGLAVAPPGATLPGAGPLADGRLTRQEAEDVVLKTADPSPEGGELAGHWPTTPVYYTYEGYGVVDAASAARASRVLSGKAPAPDRSDVDLWMDLLDAARDAAWAR